MESEFERKLAELSETSARTAAAASETAQAEQERNAARVRALHCLQKLMARPDAARVFQDFDTDNDGSVSRAELHEGLRQMGLTMTEVEMEEIMAIVDTDGDDAIDYSEFVRMGQMREELARKSEEQLQEERAAQEQRVQEESDARASGLKQLQSAHAELVQSLVEVKGAITIQLLVKQ